MLHPYFENTAKTIQYIFIWITYAILQIFVMYSLVAVPFWVIVLDGFIHATVFGVLGILLWSVLRYGNYAVLNSYQLLINYIALGLLSISIWLGIGYGILYWFFGNETAAQFIQVLPVRGFIGLLVYLLMIQQYGYKLDQFELKNEMDEPVVASEELKSGADKNIEVLERIAVKSGSKIHVVTIPEIYFLQADGDYVQIFSINGKYLKEQTMKYFEEHLPENQFVRVHRSIIVNVEMISRIELYEKQSQLLTLKNGQQIKTSPSGYKALRMVLNL